MSYISSVNTRELFFEHKQLTRINGEPNFESLHGMHLEYKANCSSVPCTLGGGVYGYSGILLLAKTYATLAPDTPFIVPLYPGILIIEVGATQYEISLAKTQHDEASRIFSEYNLIMRALIQQVLEAIGPKYLTRLRNRVTGQVPANIRLLFSSLFAIYGKVSANQLKEKYDEVASISYDITEPIDVIFNDVDNLKEIADLAGRPYSLVQMVDLGYIVIAKQPIFRFGVRRWLRRPPEDQTWQDFQDVFTIAHQELRDTEASLNEIGFQSANAIVTQIVDELRNKNMLQNQSGDVPPVIPNPPPPPVAASTQESLLMLLMATMQSNMEDMRAQLDTAPHNSHHVFRGGGCYCSYEGGYHGQDRSRGRDRGRERGRGRNAGRVQSPCVGKYCFTHGNCAHTDAEFNTPNKTHNAGATFANMQGGRTEICQ